MPQSKRPYAPKGSSTIERIWHHVVPGERGCWDWRGAMLGGRPVVVVRNGAGNLSPRPARRLVYEHSFGVLPERWVVEAVCGNPRCINPTHGIVPKANRRKYRSPRDRFWDLLRTNQRTGCREWIGSRSGKSGYGRVLLVGRWEYAHRHAYELVNGPVPDGLFVCHHCDNPSCCNPDHLYAGTAQDNANDRVLRGRQGACGRPRKQTTAA